MNDAVLALLNASKSGTTFLFGPLAASPGEPGSVGFILIFQVLPVAIFFSAFTAALYHLRVLQWVVRLFAKLFHRTMAISGAESLCGASNIFVGVESALVIRPYLEKMTRSELLTVLTTGMATVASSTLGVYVAFLIGVFPTDRRTSAVRFDTGDSGGGGNRKAAGPGDRDAGDSEGVPPEDESDAGTQSR